MGLCLTGTADEVADIVFLTNDSLNVEWIAANLLTNVKFYNDIRNMRGCTGEYKGKRVSVQGEGIGPVNAAMYAVEIMNEFDVKKVVKIDTCTALKHNILLGDMILPQSAHTTSSINKRRFNGITFPAVADFQSLDRVYDQAVEKNIPVHVGPVVSIEHRGEMELARKFALRGAIAIDLEMNQTFTAAQRFGIPGVGILIATENFITEETMQRSDKQKAFAKVAEFALESILMEEA